VIKYGILDDDGRVIRWVWERPSSGYQFVTVKVPRPRKPKLDLSQFPDALM
jgi:hypothetical protein